MNIEQVKEIRRRRSAGEYGTALAKEFGVHSSTIYEIALGKIWADEEHPRKSKLTESEREQQLSLLKIDPQDRDLLELYRWRLDPDGYFRAAGGKRRITFLLHRVILQRIVGRPLALHELTDHINHNRQDNRRDNLRMVDKSGNARNLGRKTPNCSSRFIGVAFDRSQSDWVAYIGSKKTRVNIGRFKNEIDAAKARNLTAQALGYLTRNEVPA